MAWNESFSVADGGGWAGDVSFTTTAPKEAQSLKIAERLPVPATISDLHDCANVEEKFELGDFPFSMVLTVGIVKSVSEQENTSNHVLGDPEDMSKEFEVLTYNGVSDTDFGSTVFVEGTKVMVVGKLRSLSDRHGIMSYNIREIIDEKEYHAFRLEARIAKIYFQKNVPSVLRSGMGQTLSDVQRVLLQMQILALEEKESLNVFGTQPSRIFNSSIAGQTSSSRGHNLVGQRGKIMDLLQREKDNYDTIGLSEGEIKKAIGAMNMDSLRKDLQFLVNEGHIYNTTDDEHYALID
ncbi:hypothetical protein KIN20_036527 [Parelaphostrongylus tenuis]|uniref:Replication protein A C-terminal domain-containing protein n=1 Tax=Parelaphostrongylus tenuis TaxID=148309 RepID=A0AAD5RD28_PARTN|nr:hypothetical protein KIN20_036527 [Parelaphostrongylus tenuis]